MIEARELRVGNYVCYESPIEWDYHIVVKGVQNDLIDTGYKKWLEVVKIFPIKLTEEWLVRIGLPEDRSTLDIYGDWDCYFERINNELFIGYGNMAQMMRVDYVHDAQNLYYCNSGKKELKINNA